MSIIYFDTSMWVKLMLQENGSEHAAQLWRHATAAAIGRSGYPEAHSALAIAHRTGRINANALRQCLDALHALWNETAVVELSPKVAQLAGELTHKHHLRAYDAVHLATAMTLRPDLFASADKDLVAAAQAEGLATSH